jgi:hypothetical protein
MIAPTVPGVKPLGVVAAISETSLALQKARPCVSPSFTGPHSLPGSNLNMDGQLKEIHTSPQLSTQNATLEHLIAARCGPQMR